MATRRGQSPEVLWSFLPRPRPYGGVGIFGRTTEKVEPRGQWEGPRVGDCPFPIQSRSSELFSFLETRGCEIRRTALGPIGEGSRRGWASGPTRSLSSTAGLREDSGARTLVASDSWGLDVDRSGSPRGSPRLRLR